MKRLILISIVCTLLAGPSTSSAQVFYQYPEAPVVDQGALVIGPCMGGGTDDLIRLGGFGRFGLAKYIDMGLEVLLDSRRGRWRGGGGADVKFGLLTNNRAIPFDISVDTGIGFISGDNTTILQIPFGGIISSPFQLENESMLVPYLGVYMLYVETELDKPVRRDDSDLDVELRGGLSLSISPSATVFATLHLGRDEMFFVGANFRI